MIEQTNLEDDDMRKKKEMMKVPSMNSRAAMESSCDPMHDTTTDSIMRQVRFK